MPVSLSDAWGDDDGTEPFPATTDPFFPVVSARAVAPAAAEGAAPATSPPPPREEALLQEVLALRREMAHRTNLAVVGALVFAALLFSYVDGLHAQLRAVREHVSAVAGPPLRPYHR